MILFEDCNRNVNRFFCVFLDFYAESHIRTLSVNQFAQFLQGGNPNPLPDIFLSEFPVKSGVKRLDFFQRHVPQVLLYATGTIGNAVVHQHRNLVLG